MSTTAWAQPTQEQLGEAGESCRAKRDCAGSLVCLNNVCALAGVGESCQARADCSSGLACINNTCVPRDETAPVPVPVAPQPHVVPQPQVTPQPQVAPQPAYPEPAPYPGSPDDLPPPLPPASRDWWDFQIGNGTVPYAGVALGPGFAFALDYNSGNASQVFGGFLFALKAGFLFGLNDLQLEISPVTWLPATAGQPVFQTNISIGSYNHIAGDFYWPLRFGIGVAAVNLPDPIMVQRIDLIGLVYKMGHVLFEANLPSFRHGTDFSNAGLFAFSFNLGASYAFTEL